MESSSSDDEDSQILPATRMRGVAPYSPPKHPAPVDLLLAGNEGRCPDSEGLRSLADQAPELLRRYPKAAELEAMLAEDLGVEAERVFVTAGGDDALARICHAYLEEGREFILPEPSFEMLPRYASLAGGKIISIPWLGGAYPLQKVIDAITPQTSLIAVVSPNNPTGAVATKADLIALSKAAPHALLMVDLAYVEYGDEDLSAAALALPNAVIFRTLSKAWGLAGLRIGYAAGPLDILNVLRAAGNPYPVSGPSLYLAKQALLGDRKKVKEHVESIRENRTRIQSKVQDLAKQGVAIRSFESQGNFVLVQSSWPEWLRDAMAGLGIAIRFFGEREYLTDKVRITVPEDGEDCSRVEQALAVALRPQALIFDMDGVLANVSQSYRSAIVQSAAKFGAQVDAKQIHAIKAKGNANNDWDVTHRLVLEAGQQVDFESVKAEFERLYQGTPETPGLWTTETLVPSRELLKELSTKLPMAIVTGRPKADAIRFLQHFELEEFFPVCICMEDAKLKPDPEPVQLALKMLGVERAWMVGDTPDDIIAARAANVIGLGFTGGVDEDQSQLRQTLLTSGAARSLEKIEELQQLLNSLGIR